MVDHPAICGHPLRRIENSTDPHKLSVPHTVNDLGSMYTHACNEIATKCHAACFSCICPRCVTKESELLYVHILYFAYFNFEVK